MSFHPVAMRKLVGAVPRLVLVSATLAVTACGGGTEAVGSPSPAPTPTPATPSPPSTPSTPSPTPTPTPNTVCGSAFLGNATAQFGSSNCSTGSCANTGPANAIDNNRDTAAIMTFSGSNGTMILSARTQSGTVVPAGKMAGALLSLASQTAVSTTVSFKTYLNNAEQETGGRTTNTVSPSTSTTPNFQRFANTKAYDRIDVIVEQSGSVTTRIFEICSE